MDFILMPPAIESLLRPTDEDCPWPEEIRVNPELKRLVKFRVGLSKTLEIFFGQLAPKNLGISGIKEAIESRLVDPEMVARAYDGLTTFLGSDSANRRLVLYLPFEIVPLVTWRSESKHLAEAISRFHNVYLTRWYELLSFSDVRANFVDGDIPEPELRVGPLGRVIKATHLVPKLVEKGLLSVADVVRLIEENRSCRVLVESLTDTLPILADLGLLTQGNLDQIVDDNHLKLGRERKKDVPAIITPARKCWLERCKREMVSTEILTLNNELDASFSDKRQTLREGIRVLDGLITSTNIGGELSRYLYPAIIFFGSRLKGYGTKEADLDYAVFVRPDIDMSRREEIRCLLSKAVPAELSGKAIEFWLDRDGHELRVKNPSRSDWAMADGNWAHVLFSGAWYGEEGAIKKLHQRLLTGYLYQSGPLAGRTDRREIWLEELERDALQYRLMHSGYDRFYPKQGRIRTEHSGNIDGEATFFDSGFRRLATRLFITRVFLPKLRKS